MSNHERPSTTPERTPPAWRKGDDVRIAGQQRVLIGDPFWLEDMQKWRVLTAVPGDFAQYVDCDELASVAQLALF